MLIIIDEISMVSSKLFYQIHKRLNEVFSPAQDALFGGKSFWYVETCISYTQFVQDLYLHLIKLKLRKDLPIYTYGVNSNWQKLIK